MDRLLAGGRGVPDLASGAEAQPRTSVVEGTVVDVSGAAIADAVISIRNADTSQVRVTATGREGSFRMPATPVGTYEVASSPAASLHICTAGSP